MKWNKLLLFPCVSALGIPLILTSCSNSIKLNGSDFYSYWLTSDCKSYDTKEEREWKLNKKYEITIKIENPPKENLKPWKIFSVGMSHNVTFKYLNVKTRLGQIVRTADWYSFQDGIKIGDDVTFEFELIGQVGKGKFGFLLDYSIAAQ